MYPCVRCSTIYKFIYLFIYFWLRWVFVSVRGLSPAVASRGHSSLRCAGLSLSRPLLLRSTGSRRAGSVVVAHGLSCSVACGIFPDQGSNPCPLHWQADSQPLRHQGNPAALFIVAKIWKKPKCPSIDEWIKKMLYIYSGILLSHKKWNLAISDSMDGPRVYYTKWISQT